MSDTTVAICDLVCRLSHADGRSETTISRLASGSGATISRLRAGGEITSGRAARIMQWLSDHWPEDAPWPADVRRPAPAADRQPTTRAEVIEAVEDAMCRREAAIEAYRAAALRDEEGDYGPVVAAERDAKRLAATPVEGRAVEEAALLAVPGATRRILRDVRARPNAGARPNSVAARLLAVLAASGDPRYAGRRAA